MLTDTLVEAQSYTRGERWQRIMENRKDDYRGNAVIERLFGSEIRAGPSGSYQTRKQARADIVEHIKMFHNSHRLHSYLG